jgi:hypothetical protein
MPKGDASKAAAANAFLPKADFRTGGRLVVGRRQWLVNARIILLIKSWLLVVYCSVPGVLSFADNQTFDSSCQGGNGPNGRVAQRQVPRSGTRFVVPKGANDKCRATVPESVCETPLAPLRGTFKLASTDVLLQTCYRYAALWAEISSH